MFQYVIYGGILLSPWIWWPLQRVSFEVPRGIFIVCWIFICLAGFLIQIKKIKFPVIRISVLLPLIFFTLWSFFVSFLGSDVVKSVAGNYYRFDGLLLLISFVGLALVVCLSKLSSEKLFYMIAWSGVLISIGSLCTWLGYKSGLYSTKFIWGEDIGFTFGNPHYLSGFLVVCVPAVMTYIGLNQGIKRLLWAMSLLLMHITIFLTGAYLSIAALIIVWIWKWSLESKYRYFVGIIATFVFFGVFLGWVFRPVVDFEPESRARLWHRLITGVMHRPSIGFGWANVDAAIEETVWPFPVLHDVYVDKAHSEILEVLATTGIVGMVLYGWLLISVLHQLIVSNNNQGWMLLVIAYLIHSQLNVISSGTMLLFWLAIGVALTSLPTPSSSG